VISIKAGLISVAVEIVRRPFGSAKLSAFVVQGGRRGRDLLAGRKLTSVRLARREARGRLDADYPGRCVKIHWEGERP